MLDTLNIVEQLAPELGESAAKKLASVWAAVFAELQNTVTKSDFAQLQATLRELAEAQKRTEQTVKELVEAQKHTEQRLNELAEAQKRTEQTVKELVEAQKQTEERVNELAEAQKRTEGRLDRLEATVVELAEAQKRTEGRLDRLEATVAELAEAQKRTEGRLDRLEATVAELAEAQKRTEDRVERLEVAVAQLAEAQKRTEQTVKELVEAQKHTEQRLNELAEAQRHMARTLDELIRVVQGHADRLAVLDGRTLELQFRDKASAYLGTVLRRTRVIPPGDLGDDLEGVLTPEEWADLLRADAILRGRALLNGERREVYVVAEVSASLDEGDVARAARRAALLRKKGWKVLAVAAGTQTTPELIASARQLGVAVLRDGEQFNWPEALRAA